MPISYTIDRTREQLHTVVEGRISVQEILDHLDAVLREQTLAYAELIDANNAGQPRLSPTEVWRAANAVRNQQLPKQIGPRAVIVRDDVNFGLTRIFTNLVSGHFPIEVFRDQEKAEEWLAEWRTPPSIE